MARGSELLTPRRSSCLPSLGDGLGTNVCLIGIQQQLCGAVAHVGQSAGLVGCREPEVAALVGLSERGLECGDGLIGSIDTGFGEHVVA
jgi:hypothetical protein